MLSTTARRLPGIRFEAQVPAAQGDLPRMDVAAFVGFASCGPLDVPVPVEDMARFREVFGADLPLAWDAERGRMQTAHLASAVEAFFSNGGRRCWVVRVAGQAETHRFALPGLYNADDLSQPAQAVARCPGSWADGLLAGTALESESLQLTDFQAAPGDYRFETHSPRSLLQAGDLIRLRFGPDGPVLLAVVDSAESLSGQSAASRTLQRAVARQAVWLAAAAGSPPLSPPAEEAVPADLLLDEADGIAQAQGWQQQSSPPRLPAAERLSFEIVVWKGEEVHSRLGGLAFAPPHPRFWAGLPQDAQRFRLPGEPPRLKEDAVASQAAAREFSLIFPLAGLERLPAFSIPWQMAFVAELEHARGPEGSIAEETRLQRDGLEDFSAEPFLDRGLAPLGSAALLAEAHHQRYVRGRPLLGLHSLLPVEEASLVAVPDAVHPGWHRALRELPDLLDAPRLQAAAAPGKATALLSWTTVAGAESYQLQRADDPSFESPQTVHQGAETEAEQEFDGDCPQFDGDCPQFDGDCPQKIGDCPQWRVFDGNCPQKIGDCPQWRGDCPQWRCFRVRARRGGEVSPWSNTESLLLPEADFEDCGLVRLDAPALEQVASLSPPQEDFQRICWSTVAGALSYRLQTASDPAFLDAHTIYAGAETEFERRTGRELTYYRVRAEAGSIVGPWSETRFIFPGGLLGWTMLPPSDYGEGQASQLLAVQRALLRFCAARADLAAVLSLPRHYREQRSLDHLSALRSQSEEPPAGPLGVRPFSAGEAPVLGYGALYHPWPHTRRSGAAAPSEAVQLTPPEGAVCGTAAARARTAGAWAAPANQPLTDVVSLDPTLAAPARAELFQAQLNLLIADPRGFLVKSADTLSEDPQLRPLNVRRLLILLRRLALREGQAYVFEPNTAAFRRRVGHRFEQVLASLYSRGAFRGETASNAYRVVTDESVNTPQSLEQGRFIVELRVAPSRPLAFLTVRLIQAGPEGLAVEEF